jgi:membrane-associated phospholipid phosphatase
VPDSHEAHPPAGLTAPLALPPCRPVRDAVVAVLLALAAAGGLFAAFTGVGPARVDGLLLDESLDARSAGLTALAVTVTEIGSTVAMAVLAVAVGIWCWSAGRRADAVLAVGAMAGAAGLVRGLKELLDRPRPPVGDRLVVVQNESLPSGHATMAVVVIGTVVVLAWAGRGTAARVAMVAAAAGWIGTVGLTRIYLGVHWFSDVAAGWLVGGAWLALCVAVWSWWRARRMVAGRSGG